MPKAIVEVSRRGEYFDKALELARRADAGEPLPAVDYHLGFANAAQLFGDLTPARLALLERLKSSGPLSIKALAAQLGRNYSNVHADTTKLLELGLVEKNAAGKVLVPWEEIQIRVTLGGTAAAKRRRPLKCGGMTRLRKCAAAVAWSRLEYRLM
ncbi:MarR family transcriptional regulator [Thiococcus pfennigii]|uniref:HVO_A0114 family putative DNA-binding protein n=1 Tax=Thiococcus pfennigii TaxID=1057 RepID=UPI00190753E4|nr:MarR family transcriptional regulator [Thiococcus pfennigii]